MRSIVTRVQAWREEDDEEEEESSGRTTRESHSSGDMHGIFFFFPSSSSWVGGGGWSPLSVASWSIASASPVRCSTVAEERKKRAGDETPVNTAFHHCTTPFPAAATSSGGWHGLSSPIFSFSSSSSLGGWTIVRGISRVPGTSSVERMGFVVVGVDRWSEETGDV